MTLTDRDLLDALCRNVIGKPFAVCDWRDVVRVRDILDELLSRTASELQISASTSLADRQLERDPSETEGSERVLTHLLSRRDLPAPKPAGAPRFLRAAAHQQHPPIRSLSL